MNREGLFAYYQHRVFTRGYHTEFDGTRKEIKQNSKSTSLNYEVSLFNFKKFISYLNAYQYNSRHLQHLSIKFADNISSSCYNYKFFDFIERHGRCLTRIELSFTRILTMDDFAVQRLCHALTAMKSLQTVKLDFSHCDAITVKGVNSVAYALRTFIDLRTLQLNFNDIRRFEARKSLQLIIYSLARSSNLKEVSLQFNDTIYRLRDGAINNSVICNLLYHLQKINIDSLVLTIENSLIDDEIFDAFMSFVTSSSVRQFDLSLPGHRLSDNSLTNFITFLEKVIPCRYNIKI